MPDADHQPFDQRLIQVHQDKGKALLRLARRKLNAAGLPASRVDAEDILQEALLTVLGHARDKQIDDLYPYLCAVVRNKVRDTCDKARRKPADPIDTADRTAETYKPLHVSAVEEDIEGRLDLKKLLKDMSPQQRRLILLSKGIGYSHAEIATLTGLHKGTVATHISRATRYLATTLAFIACLYFTLWTAAYATLWIDAGSDGAAPEPSTPLVETALAALATGLITTVALVTRRRRRNRAKQQARDTHVLQAMLQVAPEFDTRRNPPTPSHYADRLHIPEDWITLDTLRRGRLSTASTNRIRLRCRFSDTDVTDIVPGSPENRVLGPTRSPAPSVTLQERPPSGGFHSLGDLGTERPGRGSDFPGAADGAP
ncbi:RNA polymerase sigma factor [Streptomyces sp. NPDC056524]|uniref:RNA polymerase sigma factor n=1 Tax=Streptomyces sp. NPDC056524 TaxID=3345851 RepID=UPI00367A41C9